MAYGCSSFSWIILTISIDDSTMYSFLGKFEKEGIIKETEVQGRKRSYIITEKGKEILFEEYKRLITMVKDGEFFMEGNYVGQE